MQSDKYICVRDTSGQQATAVIVEVADPSNPVKFPVTADSILVHPAQKILSLRGNIFNFFFIIFHNMNQHFFFFFLKKSWSNTSSLQY